MSLTVAVLEERLGELRQTFRQAGVPICSLNSWGQFSMADPAAREAMERQVTRALELAAELGSPQVKTFGGALPEDVPQAAVFDYVAEHIGRIARRGVDIFYFTPIVVAEGPGTPEVTG